MADRPCPCGSGEASWWAKDARGIETGRVCSRREAKNAARYRPEVLTDPNYSACEAIEEEE